MLGLDEIVVVGYGTQRKEAVIGSVVSIRGDIIEKYLPRICRLHYQGRIAGVENVANLIKTGS